MALLPPLRSLRGLTTIFLLAFFTATTLTGYLTYSATRGALKRLVDARIAAASDAVIGAGQRTTAQELVARIGRTGAERDTGDLGFELTGPDGRQLGGNVVLSHTLPPGFSTIGVREGIKGLNEGRALVRQLGGGYTLTTVAETEPIDNYHAARARIYVLGFGSIVLIVIAGLTVFGLLVSRRGRALRATANAIIDGDMASRVPIDGSHSEFDQQAHAFNRMLDRIADLMAAMHNVSSDVAHDLRAPLARLRGQLDRLARRPDAAAVRDEIEDAIATSDELLAMFAAVLRIAEVEGGDRRAGFARLDLGELAEEVVAVMEPVVADSGRSLAVGPCPPVAIQGDRQLLTQALINLIANAQRHTPQSTHIAVAVSSEGSCALLTVSDDGPGIAEGQHTLALRRFGRLDKSRGGAGHGLGLPLVEAIARLHRGSITLEDARPGLRVVMRVPRA
ncbi:ATP-binding protein [Sphingomonas sp.]|uniref:sensor histidine kinase n=1 Tax=Sphingomonas sp. TaxID=28214 RepID=UPI001B08D011|nr:ATP-binding protein [Sphingomonas sp.]MBO9712119.1 two-component sensor histidine kinase [Sphingomonas sp.]